MAPKAKLKPAAALAGAIEDLFTSLNRHIQRSEFDFSVKLSDQVLSVAPGDEDAIRCNIVALIKNDNIEEALSTIDSFSKKSSIDFSFFKAYCLYRQNNLSEALEALKGKEESIAIMLLESQILFRLGKMDDCVGIYQKLQMSKIDTLEINFIAGLVSAGRASEVESTLNSFRVKPTSSFEIAGPNHPIQTLLPQSVSDIQSAMQDTGASVRAEDVISKLKDDGDFDRLRVQIIRKLKDNEGLRNNIISMVKQSTALNCPGAENMKPRQLSDAIHQELGNKLTGQVSDGVWDVIRSADGMQTEIRETVQSVYDKLSYPNGKDNGDLCSTMNSHPIQYEIKNNGHAPGAGEFNGKPLYGEPTEPPGSVMPNPHKRSKNYHMQKPNLTAVTSNNGKSIEVYKENNLQTKDILMPESLDSDAPPGFPRVLTHKGLGNVGDEDPEVPPGFG